MRHSKLDRMERRDVTPQRLAAAKSAIRRDLAKVPLFPELITETDPRARCERQEDGREAWRVEFRKARADGWRAARRRLRALPPELHVAVLWRWETGPFPSTPEYLASLVRDVELGNFNFVKLPPSRHAADCDESSRAMACPNTGQPCCACDRCLACAVRVRS